MKQTKSRRTSTYRRYLETAMRLAREAGTMIQRAQGRKRQISYKGTINLVTEMDRKAERLIARDLARLHPDHDFFAEEEERNRLRGSPFRWIVDPLDGTTNYAHGLPIYAVSIALEERGEIVVGAVYQPVLDEMFTAVKGEGTRLNGRRIEVTAERKLERSLLVTGFPYDMHENKDDNLDHFRDFQKRARAVRRLGSAALDLCYVACGRFEGFWEKKLAPWDLAAGALICREAGARVTNLAGGKFSIYEGSVIASNGKIHAAMRKVLQRR